MTFVLTYVTQTQTQTLDRTLTLRHAYFKKLEDTPWECESYVLSSIVTYSILLAMGSLVFALCSGFSPIVNFFE